jgi:N-acetylmuramoyl-L-alanine amidase
MIQTLLQEARVRTVVWRRELEWYWLAKAKDHLPFVAMLAAPAVALTGILTFAYLNEPQVQMPSTETLSQEIKRAQKRESDLQCLAENIYFESRGEPLKGQYAVAEVTLNRTRSANFPHTVCGVVHEMRYDPSRKRMVADFSWTELGAMSPEDDVAWRRAMTVATAAYDDAGDPIVPGALFYHSKAVHPGWAKGRQSVATIGNHVFYR